MELSYEIQDLGAKGKGIISKQFVKAGDLIYTLSKDKDIISVIDYNLEEYLRNVPDVLDCLSHGFCSGGKFIDLSESPARFTNHSFDPSSKYLMDQEISIALRDIHPGDEITENYWDYALPTNYDRLMKQHVHGNFRDQSVNWH